MNHYDAGAFETFFDIYATSDSSYIAVGGSSRIYIYGGLWFIVRVNPNGQTIWSHTYGDYVEGAMARSVIEADNGDFLAAGQSARFGSVDVIRIDGDGEQLWRRQYMAGDARAIIELKSGLFLICGMTEGQGYLLLIDGEGEEIWSRDYPIGNQQGAYGFFTSMRETDNQVVISGEGTAGQGDPYHPWLVKVDLENEGDIIWERHNRVGNLATCNTLISCENGFTVSGMADYYNCYLMKVSQQGEPIWNRIYDNQYTSENGFCLAITPDDGFAIAGQAVNAGNPNRVPIMIRTSSEGDELGRSYHDFSELEDYQVGTCAFYSVITDMDNSLVAAGNVNTNETGYDGLIMKWEEEHEGPFFVSWTPEDTVLSVLHGDSIQFAVHIRHQWDEAFDIYWWVDEGDTVSNDTTITHTFDELGEYLVNCSVTDGRVTRIKRWHISAVEFYLRGFQPDSSEITVRRTTSVDFLLDIARLDHVELDYWWMLRRNERNEELDGEDSIRVNFFRTGDSQIEARIMNGDIVESANWNIHVVSSIWWWWPHELEVEIPVDTLMDFALFPFNEESDSLDYRWWLDGEIISDRNEVFIDFGEVGQYEVKGILRDGADIDSVSWAISVVLPDEINGHNEELIPGHIMLYPPSPNPFNSSTKITYYLSTPSDVTLQIYNTHGQIVDVMLDRVMSAGRHSVVWDGSDLCAGVYLIRMKDEGGRMKEIQKVVLVK